MFFFNASALGLGRRSYACQTAIGFELAFQFIAICTALILEYQLRLEERDFSDWDQREDAGIYVRGASLPTSMSSVLRQLSR